MKAFFEEYGLIIVVIAIFGLFILFAKQDFMKQLTDGILENFNKLLGSRILLKVWFLG
ncbi:hypothetical protein [Holdemania massiliensis]|uniref:hypothetical protein n=1 Tax=Holdemania massiliensis TaxID=1468449 RepID=UPI001F061EB8|nr:hypothetical protein [Holdemania massiliensis]MCH1942441.1 hypothetical protein [Holdemania massiliensis]